MQHRTVCPNCKKAFKVKPEMHSKKSRCPGCKQPFVINVQTAAPPTGAVAAKPSPQPNVTQAAQPATASPPIPPPATPVVEVVSPAQRLPVQPAQPQPVQSQPVQSQPVSPFESLVTQHMAPAAVAMPAANDQQYLQQHKQLLRNDKHDELDLSSMRFAARGIALMLFGIAVAILAFLGLHMPELEHACPIGALLGTMFGGAGAILVMIGLFRRMGYAVLLGGLPALFFLLSAVGVGYLYFQGYWHETYHPDQRVTSNFNKGTNSNSSSRDRRDNSSSRSSSDSTPKSNSNQPNNSFSSRPGNSSLGQTVPNAARTSEHDPIKKMFDDAVAAANKDFNSNQNNNDDDDDPFGFKPDTNEQEQKDITEPAKPSDAAIAWRQYRDSSSSFRTRNSKLGRGMQNVWGSGYRLRFPKELLAEPAGDTDIRGVLNVFADEQRSPMIGLDGRSWAGGHQGVYEIQPIFDRSDDALTMAKEGYVVGGLNVAIVDKKVSGIRCVFVKLVDGKLDTNDFYYGRWLGEKPGPEKPIFISGDGQVVFGLYYDRSGVQIKGVGLVRQTK